MSGYTARLSARMSHLAWVKGLADQNSAYRLMRSPLIGTAPEATTSNVHSKEDRLRRRQERRKGVGVQGSPDGDLQAALQEVSSFPRLLNHADPSGCLLAHHIRGRGRRP